MAEALAGVASSDRPRVGNGCRNPLGATDQALIPLATSQCPTTTERGSKASSALLKWREDRLFPGLVCRRQSRQADKRRSRSDCRRSLSVPLSPAPTIVGTPSVTSRVLGVICPLSFSEGLDGHLFQDPEVERSELPRRIG